MLLAVMSRVLVARIGDQVHFPRFESLVRVEESKAVAGVISRRSDLLGHNSTRG